MSGLAVVLVGVTSGLLGGLGMGAGTVLLVYLRVWGGMEQVAAQGVNLIFFLPVALLSIFFHARHHLIDGKIALLCVLAGLPAVFAGVYLISFLDAGLLGKLFAVLLLFVGIRALFAK